MMDREPHHDWDEHCERLELHHTDSIQPREQALREAMLTVCLDGAALRAAIDEAAALDAGFDRALGDLILAPSGADRWKILRGMARTLLHCAGDGERARAPRDYRDVEDTPALITPADVEEIANHLASRLGACQQQVAA